MSVNKDKEEKKSHKIGNIIAAILSWIMIGLTIMILVMAIVNVRNPGKLSVFGYRVGIVGSQSMNPKLKKYDIIFYVDEKYENIEKDDIIVFNYIGSDSAMKGRQIIHRVVRITDDGKIYTKGDNNESEDLDPVTKDNYIGKYVWDSYFFGIAKIREKGINFVFALILIMFLIIIISSIINIYKETKKAKIEKAKQEIIEEYEQNKQKDDEDNFDNPD